ncbi:DUF6602 domain-containing protein [Pectinatus frisingensis]|uniref:DUF6602 domain-containing protein n=1 Tax=Pectinatus frisingensis TaxID=865 RepID=UPI0018C80BA2|nr:DUF6602 domain-containing protein [Pectinatus frisingensis]
MCDTESPNLPANDTIRNIINNYLQNEKSLVNQLYFTTSHGPTIGGFREEIWKGMFEQIIPKKFVIEQSVFIIDSNGNVSHEVDLAIFDETYTPYIFHYGKLKFIPIEAVAVVIECKSSSLNQDQLKNWAKSVAALKTANNSYTRIYNAISVGEDKPAPTQSATRPLRILCCLKENVINIELDSGDKLFDFVIQAIAEKSRLKIEIDETKKNLRSWYLALNHVGKESDDENTGSKKLEDVNLNSYQVGPQEKPVSLLTLNLMLNQILMLINNPMLFPHRAYADMFNKCKLEDKVNGK